MIARVLAVVAGALILATVAHVNIIVTGGYGTPHSYVTIAVASGVTVGSLVVGAVWSTWRPLAIWLLFCMVCGEAYQLLGTAERLVKGRESEQAPLREQQAAHAKAKKRVEAAQKGADNPPTTSKALEKAEAAKAKADAAVVEKSAERGCRENCRQLLQAQVDSAAADVEKAKGALAAIKAKADKELEAARADLALIKAPESPTALADRTGIPAWIIDLVTSALGSIAANGLACCLLMFGAHRSMARVEIVTPVSSTRKPSSPKRRPERVKDHAARFALECLQPGGEAELDAIGSRYGTWRSPADRFPKSQVRQALADLFEDAGIEIIDRGDQVVAVGVSLKEPEGSTRRLT